MSDIETTRAFIERISELSSENNKLKSKLNAFEPMREALRGILSAIDLDHVKAVESGLVRLSGDAVRDLLLALDKVNAALALADKEKP